MSVEKKKNNNELFLLLYFLTGLESEVEGSRVE
jgi:hypothetical protein